MKFLDGFHNNSILLMEGSIGLRLKMEYGIYPEEYVAQASQIYHDKSRQALEEIYGQYIKIAEEYGHPLMLITPTRRANEQNVLLSDYDENIIRDNVLFLQKLRDKSSADIYIGGLMGCKGDAYKATDVLSDQEGYEFHSWQAMQFLEAGADFLYAGIMPALSEAIGMAKAMEATGLPYIISFMIRDNGKLMDGTTINGAIIAIDAATVQNPICYMTNCVHPLVLGKALAYSFNQTEAVRKRFMGIQANASALSPEELDNCGELKTSDGKSLAQDMLELRNQYNFKIFGGCCGTNQTHMEEMAKRL